MTHQFFLIFASFETSITPRIVNFGPLFVQSQPNSIELDEDEDDEQTEGAIVKLLVFYFDLHVAWDSTINRKQYTRANKTQCRDHI
jgi:hypothetical protein